MKFAALTQAIDQVRSAACAQTPNAIARARTAIALILSFARDRRARAVALTVSLAGEIHVRAAALALSFVAHTRVAWVATRAAAITALELAQHARATVVPKLARWGGTLSSVAVGAVVASATRCRLAARRARLEISTAWINRPRGWSWPRGWAAVNLVMALACVVFALRIADNLMTVVPLPPPPRPVEIPVAAKVEPVRQTSPANYDVVATRSAFHPDRDPSRAHRDRSEAPVAPAPKPILFGVVVSDDARLAYLQDPVTKQVFGYKAGDALAGGWLESIETDRVTIRRGGMLLEVLLQGRAEPRMEARSDSRPESRPREVAPAALPRRDRESVPPSSLMPPLMPPTTWGGSAFR